MTFLPVISSSTFDLIVPWNLYIGLPDVTTDELCYCVSKINNNNKIVYDGASVLMILVPSGRTYVCLMFALCIHCLLYIIVFHIVCEMLCCNLQRLCMLG